MIHFRNNASKSLEVILWFAQKRPGIDFHAILKLLFFADKEHLNQHGRPIVGGAYNALPYGPVSQPTYDILKRDPLALEVLGVHEDPPFVVKGNYCVHGTRGPDLRKLSRTDLQALEKVWAEYGKLGFNALTEESHKHPAWQNADAEGRQRMLYEEFLEGERASPEVVAELRSSARRMRV